MELVVNYKNGPVLRYQMSDADAAIRLYSILVVSPDVQHVFLHNEMGAEFYPRVIVSLKMEISTDPKSSIRFVGSDNDINFLRREMRKCDS